MVCHEVSFTTYLLLDMGVNGGLFIGCSDYIAVNITTLHMLDIGYFIHSLRYSISYKLPWFIVSSLKLLRYSLPRVVNESDPSS